MSSSNVEETKSITFTKSDRIKQLNAIDQNIVNLVKAAGNATKALTASPPSTPATSSPNPEGASLSARQAAVMEPSKQYLFYLDSIRTQIRRQIFALEEAGIISAEATARSTGQHNSTFAALSGQGQGQADKNGNVTGGGLGKLDVGWLNSRVNGMEERKQRELIDAAKEQMREGGEEMDTG